MKVHALAFALALVLFISCEKTGENSTIEKDITLDSIIPSRARIGDSVILFGKNFNFTVQDAQVHLNDIPFEIISIEPEKIKLRVTQKTGSGMIGLTVNGSSYEGPYFEYRFIAEVTTIAGTGVEGNTDGPGASAQFKCPWGLAINKDGNLVVADSYNRLIRTIDLHQDGFPVTSVNPNSANFFSPYNLAVDTTTNEIFVTDFNDHLLKVDASGNVTAFDVSATFTTTTGIAVAPDRSLYVSDNVQGKIFKMNQDITGISEVAYLPLPRNLVFDANGLLHTCTFGIMRIMENGTVTPFSQDTEFHGWELAIDRNGNYYQADHFTNKIQKVDIHTGKVTLVAGSGNANDADGTDNQASFDGPMGIVADAEGNLYVSTYNFDERTGNKIRKITFK